MEDKRKRLLRYLNDSYAAEIGGLVSLKDLSLMAADMPDLKATIDEHIRVTETQADRLKNRILALGGDKSEPKAIVDSAIAKGSSFVNMFHDKEDKLTQDLIKAYSFEHFEIGAYVSLHAYSEGIGDNETALLAMQLIDEERMAADRLERFIPQAAVRSVDKVYHADIQPEHKGGLFAIPPAAFLIPGAVLAVWGVSKWLENKNHNKAENRFATASVDTLPVDKGIAADTEVYVENNSMTAPSAMSMAGVGAGTSITDQSANLGGTTVYTGTSAYVPSSLEDETVAPLRDDNRL